MGKIIKKESMSAKMKNIHVVLMKVVAGKPACPTNKPPCIVEGKTTLNNHQLVVLGGLPIVYKGSPNNGRKVWLSTIQ